ncbi:hypothetical protein FN846DRAFT_891503 [Sphaerosporella brunnea]|uniref:Uncharacterized protein n=1 Tax=Sphaerosporella brunnea TaxID=1250544 RepID=A0A5J5ET94_9PEZI|nr:hypothetical protein FN846DRAFT_891503 [Sphaerosporella brunnea]
MILTPNTGTPKKFQWYLYRRKVLLRIDPNASESGSIPAEGEEARHQVYCTRCHKGPEDKYVPGRGHWLVKPGNIASSFLREHVWLGLPEIAQDDIKRFEGSQEDGQEHAFLVDHYLPEDDGPGPGNKDVGLLEDIDEDMGTLVDELEDITSSNAGTGSQQQRV